ncbi:MAG: metal-dependent hydrolase [Lentisphaerae bacterium]|nr:MAG: metal-dependent hydrolase [Lentisphaerota bacterium]
MRFIDPHIHMVSRTTDDYEALAGAGCIAMTEPAFWAGFDRQQASHFFDYFTQISEYEPKRAARYGIVHYCWVCLNPKEAENLSLARDVLAGIPDFLDHPNVLGIGEIGLNKNSRNELKILEEHIELAARHDQLILVHTPHLEDKLKGTRLIIDALRANSAIRPERVLIDHCEEHTIGMVLDNGFWAGITLYPNSKCTPQRAADILTVFGTERVWVNSAADWGPSDPLSVPKFMLELRRRGASRDLIDQIVYRNPCQFLAQSGKFRLPED